MFSHKPFVATNLNDNFLSRMFERIVHISEVNEDVFNISVMFPHLRSQFESRSSLSRCFESPIILSLRSSSFKNCRAFEFVKDWVKEETSVMPQWYRLERHKQRKRDYLTNKSWMWRILHRYNVNSDSLSDIENKVF